MRGVIEFTGDLAGAAQSVAESLRRVEAVFDEAIRSDLAPVADLCRHVEAYRGKMLRPTLAIVCGGACGSLGAAPAALITAGAVVEMVHMATLVHDDVLDEADTRRRTPTVSSLHGNEAAVILGDYLIAAAYRLCAELDDPAYARRIGRVSMDVCSGELLQLHHRGDFAVDEALYFDIVARKTGALVAVACELGARACGADHAMQAAMFTFGRDLGIAFQIQDDLLDLTGSEETVGKSVRKDLEKGKLTLPIIHHLGMLAGPARSDSLALLESAAAGGHTGATAALLAGLSQTGSVEYAEGVAHRLVSQAKSALSGLPPSPHRAMLDAMADAVIERAF